MFHNHVRDYNIDMYTINDAIGDQVVSLGVRHRAVHIIDEIVGAVNAHANLIEAFNKYGNHLPTCSWQRGHSIGGVLELLPSPCNCGFMATVAKVTAA